MPGRHEQRRDRSNLHPGSVRPYCLANIPGGNRLTWGGARELAMPAEHPPTGGFDDAADTDPRIMTAEAVRRRADAPRWRDEAMLTKDLAAVTAAVARDDLDTALRTILAAGGRRIEAVDAWALIWDPDRPAPTLAVAIDAAGRPLDRLAHDELARSTAAADHPTVVAARDGRPNWHRPDPATGLVAIDLPLTIRRDGVEQVVGALAWRRRRPELSAEDEALLTALADLAAVAIDRARLASLVAERAEWFERLAHTDPLTGLANARTFGRVLELELARAARGGGEVAIVLFDIVDLADLNATAGREAGDDALRAVAAVLAESVRFVDTVARLGDDEFAVVAPGAAGAAVAKRIVENVAGLPPVAGASIRVRSGIAQFPTDGTSADALLAAARSRLQGSPVDRGEEHADRAGRSG